MSKKKTNVMKRFQNKNKNLLHVGCRVYGHYVSTYNEITKSGHTNKPLCEQVCI